MGIAAQVPHDQACCLQNMDEHCSAELHGLPLVSDPGIQQASGSKEKSSAQLTDAHAWVQASASETLLLMPGNAASQGARALERATQRLYVPL